MKYFEEKLSGFSIIYFHNFFECNKCSRGTKPVCCIDSVNMKTAPPKCRPGYSKSSKHLSVKKSSKDSEFMYPLSSACSSVKNEMLKKKTFKNRCQSFKPLYYNEVKGASKLLKKKQSVERNVRREMCNFEKNIGSKIPGKGTLKRKNWYREKLNQKNENYEDDLLENSDFSHFQSLLEDESDNPEKYEDLKTPVFPFSLSPRETTPSPVFKDCYNPKQLDISRKEAEKYQYRRMKRMKSRFPKKKEDAPQAEQVQDTEKILQRLMKVSDLLHAHQRRRERTSDNEEDAYFSDVTCTPKANP